MSTIIPPLKFFHYTPISLANTSNPTGIVNNNFFDGRTGVYSNATQIEINTPSNCFNKDAFAHTFNGQVKLYLENINGKLSKMIGNGLQKKMCLRCNCRRLLYHNNGFQLYEIYDDNNFKYGSILMTFIESYLFSVNSNGYNPDGQYLCDVIYADGYYSYLIKDLNSPTNIVAINITNGIREYIIPPDPSGKYDPNSTDKFIYFPAFYYGSYNTTFVNNTVSPIQDYNTYTSLNLQASLDPITVSGNTLFQGCVTNNLNFPDNYDVLYFNCFSLEKKYQLAQSGNILGLYVNSNQSLTNTGVLNNINDIKGVIIYADGDFEYLNEITTPYTYKLSTDPIFGSTVINLPIKPANYKPPITVNLPNQEQGGVWTWNDFYVSKQSNSIIYDPELTVQNYTLATTEIYDSFDFITEKPGKVIGSAISYTNVYKTTESTQLYFTFTQCNFNNGTTLFTCYVSTALLSKVGALPNGFVVRPNVFSSSTNYIANGNILYNITATTGTLINHVQTNTILPI